MARSSGRVPRCKTRAARVCAVYHGGWGVWGFGCGRGLTGEVLVAATAVGVACRRATAFYQGRPNEVGEGSGLYAPCVRERDASPLLPVMPRPHKVSPDTPAFKPSLLSAFPHLSPSQDPLRRLSHSAPDSLLFPCWLPLPGFFRVSAPN